MLKMIFHTRRKVTRMIRPRGIHMVSAAAREKKTDILMVLHLRNEQNVLSQLTEQGRRIRIVQSAKRISTGPDAPYCETKIYTGWTAAPDLVTFIRTGSNGQLTVMHQRMHGRKVL